MELRFPWRVLFGEAPARCMYDAVDVVKSKHTAPALWRLALSPSKPNARPVVLRAVGVTVQQ